MPNLYEKEYSELAYNKNYVTILLISYKWRLETMSRTSLLGGYRSCSVLGRLWVRISPAKL